VDFACLDLSFIRLNKVFPALLRVLKPGAFWVALIKPQFEAAKSDVPEGGVITDLSLRSSICARVFAEARTAGLEPIEVLESSLPGRDGNIEFLLLGQKI
jgi:23S rRNA (cytidine1920-2'-O)/16S rRNA (cytidine1409-2'-O)-methyltransferase